MWVRKSTSTLSSGVWRAWSWKKYFIGLFITNSERNSEFGMQERRDSVESWMIHYILFPWHTRLPSIRSCSNILHRYMIFDQFQSQRIAKCMIKTWKRLENPVLRERARAHSGNTDRFCSMEVNSRLLEAYCNWDWRVSVIGVVVTTPSSSVHSLRCQQFDCSRQRRNFEWPDSILGCINEHVSGRQRERGQIDRKPVGCNVRWWPV